MYILSKINTNMNKNPIIDTILASRCSLKFPAISLRLPY